MRWALALVLAPALALAGEAVAPPPVVVIKQMAFAPVELKVKAGTEVWWRNDDGTVHIVTAEDGSFSSPSLDQGAVFKKVFAKPGSYAYTCEMHPFMSGKIVVE